MSLFIPVHSSTPPQIGMLLTHYMPIFNFYTPWKSQNTRDFLTFSGVEKYNIGVERVK